MDDNKKSIFESEEFSTNDSLNTTPEQSSSNLSPSEEMTNAMAHEADGPIAAAQNDNELFFEKFNNTKKNYKKTELEKARKQINKKNKSLSFERRLEDNRYVGTIYGIVGVVIFFILAISITVFVINFKFYNAPDPSTFESNNAWYGIAFSVSKHVNMNKAIVGLSGIAFSLVPIPFFFLLSTWFMGLNQIFRSRNFMIFLFSCIGLSALIVLITIPMFSIIYANHGFLALNQFDDWASKA